VHPWLAWPHARIARHSCIVLDMHGSARTTRSVLACLSLFSGAACDAPRNLGSSDGSVASPGSDASPAGCPVPDSMCEGSCVNLATDDLNCGACGAAVPDGATCVGGAPACTFGVLVNGSCQDLTIEGDVIPSPSRDAPGLTPSPFRPGKLNGAGMFLNAYAASKPAEKCANSTPAITRLWQHNITFSAYQSNGANDYPVLGPGEAMTWRFVAPAEGTSNQIQYNEGTQAAFEQGYLTISRSPCDFDTSKVLAGGGGDACYRSEAYGISVYYRSTVGAVQPYECRLVPGHTYYLNIRMQDARPASQGGHPTQDSCVASGNTQCGGYVQFR